MIVTAPLPPIIEDLLEKLGNSKIPLYQRQTYRMTLVGISNEINKGIIKFDREVNLANKK